MKKTLGRRIEKSYLMLVGIISLFLITGYFSYAYFTLQTEQKNRISIIAGTLNVEMKVDGTATNKLTVQANTTKEFTVTIKNINDRTARYNFYYTGTLASGVEAGYVNESGKDIPPEAKGVNINASGTQTYKIRVKNGTSSSQTISIISDVGLDYNDLELPSNGHLFTEFKKEYVIPEDTPLKKFINTKDYEQSTEEEKKNMYVFEHEAGSQQEGYTQEELTDYRYIGSDPNNYVKFNNETWRIIGIFTVEDGNGKKEKRIKLIREEPLTQSNGNGMAFDNKGILESTKVFYGSNSWAEARLMMLLNPGYETETTVVTGSIYWSRGSGKCPVGTSSKDCDFSETGLNEEAREMIGDTKWYLGASSTYNDVTAEMFYARERGIETCYTSGNCSKERALSWSGKVGLMYPSDYGYATSGGTSMSRNTCLLKELYNWEKGDDCVTNDWLYDGSTSSYTITPSSEDISKVFSLTNRFTILLPNASVFNRPVVYLKSDINFCSGTGTSSNPFTFVTHNRSCAETV